MNNPRDREASRPTRIGQRVRPGERVPITWREMKSGLIRKRHPVDRSATITNLSVTGAQVLAGPDCSTEIGQVIGIGLDGAWGTARIVRVQQDADGGLTSCGVQFLDFDPDFLDAITARQHIDTPMSRGISMRD